jgi:hypothetical protein
MGYSLRNHVLTTIRLISSNPDADEPQLVDGLRSMGYSALQAELLIAFVPLGVARPVVRRLSEATPFTWSDHVFVLKGNQKLTIPLEAVREFVEAVRLGEETFTTGIIPREDLTRAVRLSVEINLISRVLDAGKTVDIISAPILLRLGEAEGFDEWYSEILKILMQN